MSDLIRREDAIEIVIRTCGDYATAFSEIGKLPAVDAVEVVRCKDCKSYLPENHNFAKHCRLTGTEMDEDGFCSYGERREENAVD